MLLLTLLETHFENLIVQRMGHLPCSFDRQLSKFWPILRTWRVWPGSVIVHSIGFRRIDGARLQGVGRDCSLDVADTDDTSIQKRTLGQEIHNANMNQRER